jgi:hypothetical protein
MQVGQGRKGLLRACNAGKDELCLSRPETQTICWVVYNYNQFNCGKEILDVSVSVEYSAVFLFHIVEDTFLLICMP